MRKEYRISHLQWSLSCDCILHNSKYILYWIVLRIEPLFGRSDKLSVSDYGNIRQVTQSENGDSNRNLIIWWGSTSVGLSSPPGHTLLSYLWSLGSLEIGLQNILFMRGIKGPGLILESKRFSRCQTQYLRTPPNRPSIYRIAGLWLQESYNWGPWTNVAKFGVISVDQKERDGSQRQVLHLMV